MIRRNRDNKIKIPWYSRRVRQAQGELDPLSGMDASLRVPTIRPQRPRPVTVEEPVRQPATQPATDPVRDPIREPIREPFPYPFPLPGRLPGQQPQQEPEWNPPFKRPEPAFPMNPFLDPNYDWGAHFQRVNEQLEQMKPNIPEPEPESSNPFSEAFKRILEPVVYLIVGREIINQYVKANITDPIYSRMLEDPVLGLALREAEKAELDVEAVANYFAQYDWDNMDIDQMTKDLTVLVGAAGAARIIIFFIGRKVLFRI